MHSSPTPLLPGRAPPAAREAPQPWKLHRWQLSRRVTDLCPGKRHRAEQPSASGTGTTRRLCQESAKWPRGSPQGSPLPTGVCGPPHCTDTPGCSLPALTTPVAQISWFWKCLLEPQCHERTPPMRLPGLTTRSQ